MMYIIILFARTGKGKFYKKTRGGMRLQVCENFCTIKTVKNRARLWQIFEKRIDYDLVVMGSLRASSLLPRLAGSSLR